MRQEQQHLQTTQPRTPHEAWTVDETDGVGSGASSSMPLAHAPEPPIPDTPPPRTPPEIPPIDPQPPMPGELPIGDPPVEPGQTPNAVSKNQIGITLLREDSNAVPAPVILEIFADLALSVA